MPYNIQIFIPKYKEEQWMWLITHVSEQLPQSGNKRHLGKTMQVTTKPIFGQHIYSIE